MRTLFTLFILTFTLGSFAQLINYKVEIVSFSITGCDDGFGDDEEPTWKLWGRDDQNPSWTGGTCHSSDGNAVYTHVPSGADKILLDVTGTSATSVELKFEAWEDDNFSNSPGSTDRCSFDSGDDCHELWSPLVGSFGNYPAINIYAGSQCAWTNYSYSVGDFGFEVRVKWEYTNFSGGPSQSICGTGSINLGAEGSGEWSIYSGTGGGLTNDQSPTSGFSGTVGETYRLLWSNLPGCLTAHTTDTVNVYVYNLPAPQITSNVTKYCEGDEVTFDAFNATNYEFYVNDLSAIEESNVTGEFNYVLQLGDSVVYVNGSNTNCSGIDSVEFEVLAAPDPVIQLVNGVFSTTISYPFNQWYYNGGMIGGATTSSYTPTQNGSYTIEVANSDGCVASDTYILNNIGVSELQNEFIVYPNPAKDVLFIEGNVNGMYFELRDKLGRIVQLDKVNGPIQINSFESGMYFLRIFNEEGRSSIHKIEIIK